MAAARSLSPASIGKYASGSGDFYGRLRRGCDLTSRRAARVMQWLSDHWPADLPWPLDIPRPAPSPDSPAGRPPEPVSDPLAAVIEAREALMDAGDRNDWEAMRVHEERMHAASRTLGPDGRIASARALCEANSVARTVYDDVVRRYAGGRGNGAPRRAGSPTGRVYHALVASGDARFRARRAPAVSTI